MRERKRGSYSYTGLGIELPPARVRYSDSDNNPNPEIEHLCHYRTPYEYLGCRNPNHFKHSISNHRSTYYTILAKEQRLSIHLTRPCVQPTTQTKGLANSTCFKPSSYQANQRHSRAPCDMAKEVAAQEMALIRLQNMTWVLGAARALTGFNLTRQPPSTTSSVAEFSVGAVAGP